MKKLALALVCLVSVAFFASCTPEGDPTIQVLNQEGYVQNGDVVDLDQEVNFGFVVASSAVSNKELSTLIVKIDDDEILTDTIDLSGKTSFTYYGSITYQADREIIDNSTITAIVTDAAGKTASATINLSINNPAKPLIVTDFTWNRHGGVAATGLDVFGLKWTKNERAIYAVIEPLEGATLYKFDPANWETINYDTEKAALFEGAIAISQWKEFNTAGAINQDLDVLLGSIYHGEMHLMHITKGHIETFKGTDVTLTGQAK